MLPLHYVASALAMPVFSFMALMSWSLVPTHTYLVNCTVSLLCARFAGVLPFSYERNGSISRGPSPDILLHFLRETRAVLHPKSDYV
jgi:hypothetical protein